MATEPGSSLAGAGLVAAVIAAAGPLAGPYIIIAVTAFGGALIGLSSSHTRGLWPSAIFVARGVFVGLVFTGICADLVAGYWPGTTAHSWLAPVSAVLGAMADKWQVVRDWFGRRTGVDPK